jgi:hypothetical protein
VNVILWMPLLNVFKNFLNDKTNVFKWAKIKLNRNKTNLYFLLFCYFLFHTSSGNVLSLNLSAFETATLQVT